MLILAETNVPGIEIGAGLLVLLVVTFALICRYLIARMRHKEAMAAIEKGLPLSELKAITPQPNLWLKKMTFGIILSLIGPLLTIFSVLFWGEWHPRDFFEFSPEGMIPVVVPFLGTVFFIIGVTNLIIARLQRKGEMSKTNTEDGGN